MRPAGLAPFPLPAPSHSPGSRLVIAILLYGASRRCCGQGLLGLAGWPHILRARFCLNNEPNLKKIIKIELERKTSNASHSCYPEFSDTANHSAPCYLPLCIGLYKISTERGGVPFESCACSRGFLCQRLHTSWALLPHGGWQQWLLWVEHPCSGGHAERHTHSSLPSCWRSLDAGAGNQQVLPLPGRARASCAHSVAQGCVPVSQVWRFPRCVMLAWLLLLASGTSCLRRVFLPMRLQPAPSPIPAEASALSGLCCTSGEAPAPAAPCRRPELSEAAPESREKMKPFAASMSGNQNT